jgi:hypothetical protein
MEPIVIGKVLVTAKIENLEDLFDIEKGFCWTGSLIPGANA